MDCSMPGFPALHCLLEFAQTHVHWVSDAIQPSHPLLPSSPLAFKLSQHQGLFQWVSSSSQVASTGASVSASVLPMNTQGWFPLGWTILVLLPKEHSSLCQHHNLKGQFFGTLSSLWSNSLIHTWLLEKPWLWLYGLLLAKWCLWFLNMLPSFAITFLPWTKFILISWVQSP